MHIFSSWRDSLMLFKPQSFKLFGLVTLKAVVETYKTLFTNFWWLIVLYGGVDFGLAYVNTYGDQQSLIARYAEWALLSADLLYVLLLFVLFLIIRPSVQPKNWAYVRSYWKQFIFFTVLVFVMLILSGSPFGLEIGPDDASVYLIHEMLGLAQLSALLAPLIVVSPLFIVVSAFLLDSDGSVKESLLSMWRGLKFCLFNYPFLVLSLLFFYYIFYWVHITIFYVIGMFNMPVIAIMGSEYAVMPVFNIITYISMLLWPLPLCFGINFYVKRLHEQFDTYFVQKES